MDGQTKTISATVLTKGKFFKEEYLPKLYVIATLVWIKLELRVRSSEWQGEPSVWLGPGAVRLCGEDEQDWQQDFCSSTTQLSPVLIFLPSYSQHVKHFKDCPILGTCPRYLCVPVAMEEPELHSGPRDSSL